jgi:hypothetical protein
MQSITGLLFNYIKDKLMKWNEYAALLNYAFVLSLSLKLEWTKGVLEFQTQSAK